MEKGGSTLLKRGLLYPLGYDENKMVDFDAFVLLDDLGMVSRKVKKRADRVKRRKEKANV
jgi:hypothetical protein